MKKRTRSGYLKKYAEDEGISRQVAAKQLTKAGIDYSKPFDRDEANKRIAAGRHQSRAKYTKRKFEPVETPHSEPSPESEPESGAISFLEAQRRKELANAQLKELEVQKRAGELIEVATVEKAMFEKARQIRDALQSIPDRIAGIVSAEGDQAKNHATLSREIQQALEALTS